MYNCPGKWPQIPVMKAWCEFYGLQVTWYTRMAVLQTPNSKESGFLLSQGALSLGTGLILGTG